jgi:hypothetical protein
MQAQTAAAWLDPAWSYRRAIRVSNPSDELLTDYQVAVSLTAATFDFSHSNGEDLRLTDSDGESPLAHWVETYSATAGRALLFVRVPELAAGATRTLYLYYGNDDAFDVSAGAATFALYDGFDRLRNASAPLTTPTYEGSGQVVHPDVVRFPEAWNGYPYWMVMTPYPRGNDRYENPSVLASNDGTNWEVPPGLQNPLAPRPPCDHNNDPDLLYNPDTDELWIYYLDTRRASRCGGFGDEPYYDHNYIKLMRSMDGVNWTAPEIVIDWPLADNPLYVSPAVVKVGSTFMLWVVNADDFTLWTARSTDGRSFGPLRQATFGARAWHTNVEYIPSRQEYWMAYNYPMSPKGVLWFATSSDGITWTTYRNPALTYTTGWDGNIYRSSFAYDPATNVIRFWYSAFDAAVTWHVGETSLDAQAFLTQLSVPPWSVRAGSGSWIVSDTHAKRGNLSGRLTQLGGTSIWVSKPEPFANSFYLEWDMYDSLDGSAFSMVRVVNPADKRLGVGVWTGSSRTKYVFHDQNYRYTVTTKARTGGWHKFGTLVRNDGSITYYIDGQSVGSLTGQFANASRVQVEGYYGGVTTYYVDDVRVRKWNPAEPTVTVGDEEPITA